jgi:dihydroflavonol-4-reductase
MILVTGGTGLVGAHLLLELVENYQLVRALYQTEAHVEKVKRLFEFENKINLFERIEWMKANLNHIPELELAFKGIHKVYHAAAFVSFRPKDENSIRKVNIEGTANIVNLCIDFNIAKLLFVSSIASLGDLNPNETSYSEATEWNPEKYHSDYAISKYGAEMEVWRGQQEGLSTVIVNPAVIVGPEYFGHFTKNILSFYHNKTDFYPNGSTGFITAIDVARASIQLMEQDIENQRFVLVSENLSYKALIDMMASIFSFQKPIKPIQNWQMALAWRLNFVLSALFQIDFGIYKSIALALQNNSIYDNDKIKQVLGIEFTPVLDYLQAVKQTK